MKEIEQDFRIRYGAVSGKKQFWGRVEENLRLMEINYNTDYVVYRSTEQYNTPLCDMETMHFK